jgi:hypothetical protein
LTENFSNSSHPLVCEMCGKPATHLRRCRDVTPTDRGDWVQEYDEWECDECDPRGIDPREPSEFEKRRLDERDFNE